MAKVNIFHTARKSHFTIQAVPKYKNIDFCTTFGTSENIIRLVYIFLQLMYPI